MSENSLKSSVMQSHLYVLLATVLIAASFIVSEKLSGVIHPISLTLLRFVGSVVILAPVVLLKGQLRRKVLATLPRATVISLFYSIFFISLFEALETTTSLNTGTLHTLVPFTTAILCLFLFREKINRTKLAAYLFGAIGTVWVIFGGQIDLLLSFSINKGDAIFLLGALSMCCYSISMKALYRNDPMIVLVFCILVSGSIWMSIALALINQPLQWDLLEKGSYLQVAYLIVFATLATVYLYQKSTIVIGPSRVMAYIYLNPALIAIMLLVVDQSRIPNAVIPGILISTIATLVLQKDSNSRTTITSNRDRIAPSPSD